MYKLFIISILALFISACDSTPVGYTNISVKDAHAVLKQDTQAEPFMFLDVRTPGEYNGGHVPSAKNIPVQVLSSRLAEVPQDKTVYVYCESGVRSTRAVKLLVEAGYTNVINMKASMRGWRGAGFEIER